MSKTNQLKKSKYFSFQKSSEQQHGRAPAYDRVDGKFPYRCCGDLKNFGAIAVPPKFQHNGSVDAPGAIDDFFPVWIPTVNSPSELT